MAVSDPNGVTDAYEAVRNDADETNWLLLKYEENNIVLAGTGVEYEDLLQHFNDDERAFAFIRVTTGDELSKRAKFALIAWIGKDVSVLKKAKAGTDKMEIKKYIRNYAVEFQSDELGELSQDNVRQEIMKVGGANYGTGEH